MSSSEGGKRRVWAGENKALHVLAWDKQKSRLRQCGHRDCGVFDVKGVRKHTCRKRVLPGGPMILSLAASQRKGFKEGD